MPLIEWSQDLSVSVERIDRQHQQLIGMVNDLNDAMRAGKGMDVLERITGELVVYARDHFSLEERYFQLYGYPDTARHVSEHMRFFERVEQLQLDLEARPLNLPIEVQCFLANWLREHIQKADQQYADFFHAKGLR